MVLPAGKRCSAFATGNEWTLSIANVKVKHLVIYQTVNFGFNVEMNMYQYRRDRLLALIREHYDNTRKKISDVSGWSEARISQILSPTYREGRAFSEKIARKLEADLQLDSMYFDQGAAPDQTAMAARALAGAQPVVVEDGEDERFYPIRKVKLRLSAGITGFAIEPETHDGSTISVPRSWVERNGYHPEKLVAIKVKDESMFFL